MGIEAAPGVPELYTCRMDNRPVHLSRSRIARGLGYPAEMPEYLVEAIETACSDLHRLSRQDDHIGPKGGFRLLDATCGENVCTCGGESFATGPEIAAQLQPARRLAVFTVTVGDSYEQLHGDYTRQDEPLLVYALDAAGSEMAERLADRVQQEIRAVAQANGVAISNRYSPGYCGWNVAEQHRLFALLPENFCGIKLTPSAMMQPIKSVSGIIGLGHGIKRNAYRCNLCSMRDTCRVRSTRRSSSSGDG
jgi:hypothetical protein